MTRTIWVSLLLVGTLSIYQAKAQQKVYSLKDILQKTLGQYPSLASKQNALEEQQYRRKLVRLQQLPDVHLQAQQDYGSLQTVTGSFFPLPGIYNTSGAVKNATDEVHSVSNLYGSGVLEWNFMQFGRTRAQLGVADAAIQQSSSAVTEEKFRLQVAGSRAYFTLLERHALLLQKKADADRLHELLQVSKVQADAGLRPAADTLLIQSQYLQATGAVHEQLGLLQTAQLQLSALIGEDPSTFALKEGDFSKIDGLSGSSVQDSIGNHPYLGYFNASIQYADATRKVIEKEPYPSIGLLAGAGVRGSGINPAGEASKSLAAPWQNAGGSYLAGIGITWKFSSLYQNKVKQKMADRALLAAQANLEEADLQLKTAFQSATQRVAEQRQKVWAAQKALQASRQGYELYTVRYNTGLINLIELLQLQKNLKDAEENYVRSLGAFWSELIGQSEAAGDLSFILSQLQ